MITTSKIGEYNLGYKILDDYLYITPYISVATTGGITFGISGVIVGLGVNVIDDLLIQNKYSENRILTHSFIGLTLGYNVYSSWILGLIGACSGLLLSQQMLKNYEHYYGTASHLLGSAALGARTYGLSGALIGSTLDIADQLLIINNVTDKYYFSNSLLGSISVATIFKKSAFFYAIGGFLGLVFTNYSNTAFSLQSIGICEDLYKVYSKLIPQKQLDDYIKEYAVVILSSQIIFNQLRIMLLKYEQNSMYQFEHMDEPSGVNAANKLTTITLKLSLFIFPYVTVEFLSSISNSFYSTKLYIEMDDVLRSRLFSNQTALRLSQDKNNIVLMDNLRLDSKMISREGSKLIIDSIAKSINGVYGIGVLTVDIPEVLLYLVLYNRGKEYISTFLSEWQGQYEIIITKQESIISSLFKHDLNNIKIITETGGVEYSHNQLGIEYDKLRKYELTKDQISYIIDAWRSFESIANFVYTYYLVGYKVGMGVVKFDNRMNAYSSCMQVSKLLSWNGEKSQEIKILYQSIERLENFINKTCFDSHSKIDNIKREQHEHSNLLILSNLDIKITNMSLIHTDYLELRFGNRYALEGPSGSGKSSFITKLVATTQNNVAGNGNIFYPKNAKIHLVNQQEYFPLNKSMQEVVFYPNEINSITHDKIILAQRLLTKIGLTQYDFDQIENWYNVLSGGQKREIKIISAIVQEPHVLILDEVFNGLDKKSIETMQNIIIEELPGILIISVDHNTIENNSTGFYTNSLQIFAGNLIEKKIYHNEEKSCNNAEFENKGSDNYLFSTFNPDDQMCYGYEYSEHYL